MLYIDRYLFTDSTDPGGVEGWVGLVVWPTAHSLPTKWSSVNYRSAETRHHNHWAI